MTRATRLASAPAIPIITPPGVNEGRIPFAFYADPNLNPYITPTVPQFMHDHYDRMIAFNDPTYGPRLVASGLPTLCYFDAYGIHNATDNPAEYSAASAYIMKDSVSNADLWMPFYVGTYYVGDIGNQAFRNYKLGQITAAINAGFVGIHIDDVNMGDVHTSAPATTKNPRTGAAYTLTQWRSDFADFMTQVRAAFVGPLIYNSVWFQTPLTDANIERCLRTCDYVEHERGMSDPNLNAGQFSTLLAYADTLHGWGVYSFWLDWGVSPNTAVQAELTLAAALLASNGQDWFYAQTLQYPDNWFSLYDIDLGPALGARTYSAGTYQRNFQNGKVFMREPGATTVNIPLGGTYINSAGGSVTSINLAARTGAILHV